MKQGSSDSKQNDLNMLNQLLCHLENTYVELVTDLSLSPEIQQLTTQLSDIDENLAENLPQMTQ